MVVSLLSRGKTNRTSCLSECMQVFGQLATTLQVTDDLAQCAKSPKKSKNSKLKKAVGLILSINRDLTGERVKKYILDNVQTFDQYSDYVSSGGLIDVGKTLKDLSMPPCCSSFLDNCQNLSMNSNIFFLIFKMFFFRNPFC